MKMKRKMMKKRLFAAMIGIGLVIAELPVNVFAAQGTISEEITAQSTSSEDAAGGLIIDEETSAESTLSLEAVEDDVSEISEENALSPVGVLSVETERTEEENRAGEAWIEKEEGVNPDIADAVQNGDTYIQVGEIKFNMHKYLDAPLTWSQIKDRYLVDASGKKIGFSYGGYLSETYLSVYYHLYKPVAPGTYYAYIETTDGQKINYSKLHVVDKPTIVDALYSYGYDNYGDYVHLQVSGVNLGDFENLSPVLKFNGSTVATFVEALPLGYGVPYYVCKFKKDKSALNWNESIELTADFGAGVDNLCERTISVLYDADLYNAFEHVYFEPIKKKTEFQFKQGLGIPKGTGVKVNLYDYNDYDKENILAAGSGKVDEDGLLAVSLKGSDGKDFIPVENVEALSNLKNYRIEATTDSGMVFNTDPAIYRYRINSSSGGSLTSSGSTGSVGLDNGDVEPDLLAEEESVYTTADTLDAGVFYQSKQYANWRDYEKRQIQVGLKSESINEKYTARKDEKNIGKTIWEEEKLKLQVFTPDGRELDHGGETYSFSGDVVYINLDLPKELKDYYGCYLRITSNGKTGRYTDDPNKSYYSYERNRYNDDDLDERYSDELGSFLGFVIADGSEIRSTANIRTEDDGRITWIEVCQHADPHFPVKVKFTKENRTGPIKTLTLNKSDFVFNNEYFYYFTANDIKGLDSSEPYRLTVYDSGVLAYAVVGYMGEYKGKKPTPQVVKVTSVNINETDPEVAIGKTLGLTYNYSPSNATVSKVTWKSSAPKIATVDENGVVTGIAEGSAKITLTVDGKTSVTTVKVVKKQIPTEAFEVSPSELSLNTGTTGQISVSKTPEDATDAVLFTSSVPSVASVDSTGLVTALSAGETTVTVQCGSLEPKNVKVTVRTVLDSVSLGASGRELKIGESLNLTAVLYPSGADGIVAYTGSDDGSILTLTPIKDGRSVEIKAVSAGKAVVTATVTDAVDPEVVKTASVTVRVSASDLADNVSSEEFEKIKTNLESSDNPDGLWIEGLKGSYDYNGIAVEPDIRVYAGTTRLHYGKEYTVSYKDNKRAGKGTVLVNGKGNYKGQVKAQFDIKDAANIGSKEIKKAKIEGIPKSMQFTGKPVTIDDALKLTYEGQALTQGTDYTVSYANNTDAGTANVFINGAGDFKGAVKKSFKITAVDLSNAGDKLTIEMEKAGYVASGAIPKVFVSYKGENGTISLREGVDYKLGFSGNKTTGANAGTIKLTGMGNFAKNATPKTYDIEKGDLSKLAMNAPDVAYKVKQKGSYFMSKVKILGEDGKALKEGKDYELSYLDINTGEKIIKTTAAGAVNDGDSILVCAKGLNNYAGSEIRETYQIRSLFDISKAKADKIPDQQYTGKELKPNVTFNGLTKDVDYEIVGYNKNIAKGSAGVIVRGIGKYSGVRIINFKIAAEDVVSAYQGSWNGSAFVK